MITRRALVVVWFASLWIGCGSEPRPEPAEPIASWVPADEAEAEPEAGAEPEPAAEPSPDAGSAVAPNPATPPSTGPALLAKAIRFVRRGNDTLVTVNRGVNHGVTLAWLAEPANATGTPPRYTILKITAVDCEFVATGLARAAWMSNTQWVLRP